MAHFRRPAAPELLEAKQLLTSVPFGASSQDTAEFLLGDVTVNVVFLESNGNIDADTEQWNDSLASEVKANIEEGLQWWEDLLDNYTDVHDLNFNIDYTYADQPVQTGYEPISRGSQDFSLWIEEFFRAVQVPSSSGFSREIRDFNHRQRVAHDDNWSFTIFVVNADNDANDQFGDANGNGTVFNRAFAYAGGQFIVMPHSRPASTVAHEVGHMFWAYDEYSGSEPYSSHRGYYRTQNTNSAVGHPNPSSREPSIMASRGGPFENYQISQAARETLGWRDSDGDGVFDVLDVPHTLGGTTTYDPDSQTVRFTGSSNVQTLPNRNTAGTGNDMTLNRITDIQYRIDAGPWQDLAGYDDYQVTIDVVTPPLPDGFSTVQFRTIDDRIGVTSNVAEFDSNAPAQNPSNALDVNGDGFVSPIDVLRVIISLNGGAAEGPSSVFLDVSGDSYVSAIDALMIINYINANVGDFGAAEPAQPSSPSSSAGEAEPEPTPAVIASVFATDTWQDEEDELNRWSPVL